MRCSRRVRIRFEQLVTASRERLFRFHSDPRNLAMLMGRRSGFRVVRCSNGIEPGSVTEVVDRVAGVPIRMVFRHQRCEPPHLFEEHLIRGPFAHFRHVHRFEAEGDATRVIDEIDLRAPWWLGGELGLRLVTLPRIRRVFAARQVELLRLIDAGVV